jgi:hypothetical protein
MLAFVFVQLLAAFWASVACAFIAYTGCLVGVRPAAKKDDDDGAAATATATALLFAPPGSRRRLCFAALPAVALLIASPVLFVDRHQAPIFVTPVLGQLSLTAFKLLAFAIGRGPLVAAAAAAAAPDTAARPASRSSSSSSSSLLLGRLPLSLTGHLLEFLAWAVAPILPPTHAEIRAATAEPPTPAEARALLFAAGPQALSAAFAGFIAGNADAWHIPTPVKHWFYTLVLAQCVTCVWQLWRAAAAALPKPWPRPLRTGASFDRPWMSDGLAEYWGRRWNVTTARALRTLTRDPIVEGRLVHAGGGGRGVVAAAATAAPPAGSEEQHQQQQHTRPSSSPLRRYLGMQATFLLSGLWHALVLYRPNTGTWTGAWRWMLFFSVQAPLMVVEAMAARLWSRHLKRRPLPRALRIFLTNALLIVVATPLFFGPCDWTGMCARMFDSARASVAWATVEAGAVRSRGGSDGGASDRAFYSAWRPRFVAEPGF